MYSWCASERVPSSRPLALQLLVTRRLESNLSHYPIRFCLRARQTARFNRRHTNLVVFHIIFQLVDNRCLCKFKIKTKQIIVSVKNSLYQIFMP